MEIKSSAFKSMQPIPREYTCDGKNVSPPLEFIDTPKETVSFAIIVDDPDAPKGIYTHWLAWNIEGQTKILKEGASIPVQGMNDLNGIEYTGPCPPPGNPHRYFFKLYALNAKIDLPKGSSKKDLEKAIKDHIIAQAVLVGTYKRDRR